MAEITRQVGTGFDDVWRRLTPDYWKTDSNYLRAGAFGSTAYENGVGMRFTNITIPQGATILQAYLTFRALYGQSAANCHTRISAEDVDDAPTFANDRAIFDTRWAARTTERVDWNVPNWTAHEDYNSPEIKTVIKEIVDRVGWASGQAIVIFWEDFEDRSTHATNNNRNAYSYEEDPEFAPKLFIEYEEVVGWTGEIAGVVNPASIMGVDVENIETVKGVISA